ncbi:MAG: penicillin-binding protein 2 [Chloroflexota bacterium]|nr:penicillin-binding protein 2 [Chloroflexota bacterium]
MNSLRKKTSPLDWRFILFRAVILIVFATFTLRLWQLQIVHGEYYRHAADQIRFRLVTRDAPRGVIYDRNGELLVRNTPSFTVTLIPAYLPEDEDAELAVFTRLSELLGVPITTDTTRALVERGGFTTGIQEKVNNGRRIAPYAPVVIKTGVDRETAMIIEEEHLDLPGVLIEMSANREYLTSELTSHILGYVGYVPAGREGFYLERGYNLERDRVGLTGVEQSFEAELHGQRGRRYIEVDVAGREVSTVGEPEPPVPGHNLILTLDMDLQRYVDQALREQMEAVDSQSAAVIVMNPKTGEILAMVSLPSYDNNLFTGGISHEDYERLSSDPNHPLLNHAISGLYPPGSTFKLVPAAAALEEGIINRWTKLHCDGIMWLPNERFPDDPKLAQPFYCWIHESNQGHGDLSIVASIAVSCDIFFYQVSGGLRNFQGLGLDRLVEYSHAFGYGELTGIDLAGESPGLVPDAKWKRLNWSETWTTGDTYNMTIGQGFILSTPLQVVNSTAAVANGGTLYRPQIVYQVTDTEGDVVRDFQPDAIRQIPISEENLDIVRQGMEGAVQWGTAQWANLWEVSVAGKTGTAEYCDKYPDCLDDKGRIDTLHAWFTAYAPADDPEIAIVTFVYGGGQGAESAVPVAADIIRYYFTRTADNAEQEITE